MMLLAAAQRRILSHECGGGSGLVSISGPPFCGKSTALRSAAWHLWLRSGALRLGSSSMVTVANVSEAARVLGAGRTRCRVVSAAREARALGLVASAVQSAVEWQDINILYTANLDSSQPKPKKEGNFFTRLFD